jgi:putative endopeptidase
MPTLHVLRPSALALCLAMAVAAPHADAAKKRKPAAPAPKAAPGPTACTDFYSFANADWLKAHPQPAEGSVSALGELAARAQQQQRDLLEAAAKAPKTPTQKLLGDFWASGLDEAAVERDSAAAIAPLLARIAAIKKPQDVAAAIAALHQAGIPVAFDFSPGIAAKAPGTYLGHFAQGGLGLPDPAFYTRNDADARSLLGRYNGYVQKILALSGTPQAKVAGEAQQAIDLEIKIARLSKAQTATNAGGGTLVATKDFAKKYRNLQLAAFLNAQGVTAEQVAMADPALFVQLDKYIASLKPAQWQAYLRFQVGNAMAPYLSKPWREADHEFRGRLLRGEDEPAPRWRQTLDAINVTAGAMLAHEYTARHLPAATRERADTIARDVKEALGGAIERNTWMDAQTRTDARAKLERLEIEIGGARSGVDFTAPPMNRNSFGGNVLTAAAWQHREAMKRIGTAGTHRSHALAPQHPTLSYDIADNRLYASAAVLQAPVLDMSQPLAAQYGGFGAMIGHELTRAVDTNAWNARIAPLAGFYSRFAYPGNAALKVDGTRTRNKNAVDLSGLELAWAAYEKAEPQAAAAAQQPFFRGWARLWAQQLSPQAAAAHAASAPYPHGQTRTNGPVMQSPAFGKAFACKASNAMLIPEAEQVSIWR